MKTISMRQLMSLLLVAIFPLGAELLPGLKQAGAALWLLPLLLLPLACLLLFLAFRESDTQPRHDLGQDLPVLVGKMGTRIIALLYLAWAVALLSFGVARCALRLGVAEGSPLLFAAPVLGLALWMSCGSLASAARAGGIFYRILVVGVVAVFLMAVPHLEMGEVLLWRHDVLRALPRTGLEMLGLFGVALFALFFSGSVTRRPGDRACCLRKICLLAFSTAGVLLVLFGTFGAPLVGQMARPFLQMVASLGVSGAVQRLEALFSALWMLGDLAFFIVLLVAAKHLWGCVGGGAPSPRPAVVVAVLGFAGGILLMGQPQWLRLIYEGLFGQVSLGFGALLLLLFFAVKWKRASIEKARGEKHRI